MTSGIAGEIRAGVTLDEIFSALFPCGSVTGAPKRRSMEIIANLENIPRGIYCGAIGCMAPGGESMFSVAIRTMVYDRLKGQVQMGVGSGVTWSSDPAAEYAECLAKAQFAGIGPLPPLLESMLLDAGSYPLIERHLKRLEWSASRLGHRYDRDAVIAALRTQAESCPGMPAKVRLMLSADGVIKTDSAPIAGTSGYLRLAVSSQATDPDDIFLYLKTVSRERYDAARKEYPEADEVLFVNKRGELTEGTFNNIVLLLDGRYLTPPVSSGLLPGVMRSALLDSGEIEEQVLFPCDLERAAEICLINSVRGWQRGKMIAS